MKTYEVTITETLQKTVEVEANSREEAERQVEETGITANISSTPIPLSGWISPQGQMSAAVIMNDERSFPL